MSGAEKIIAVCDEGGDFVTGCDGFVIFWPDGYTRGGMEAWHLRLIADELDRRNADWQAQIDAYFDGKPNDTAS